jgi:CubicO group peptidase (beta-lactamase class C family)
MRTLGATVRRLGAAGAAAGLIAAALGASLAPAAPALAATDPSAATVVAGGLGAELDAYLSRLAGLGFSGTAAVAKDGELVLCRGYGLADREARRPVGPETVFTVGSITKQFTGAAILKLQELGQLDVTDTLDRFFPDAPPDKAGITLHQLLTHTAGFPGAIGDDFDLTATRDAFLARAMSTELLFAPGARHEYSNVGYSLLGIVIELVSGQGYEDFLAEHLLSPAGLERTGYLRPRYGHADLAVGYENGRRWGTVLGHPMLKDGPSWHLRANGGIHSTAREMVRWVQALRTGAVLSAASREQLFAPHVDEGAGDSWYGYGWVTFQRPDGKRFLAHNGGNGIFSADCRLYPDDGVTLFVASNDAGYAPVDLVGERLAAICLGELSREEWPPETLALDETALHPYSGVFLLPSGERLTVETGPGRLVVSGAGQGAAVLLGGLDPAAGAETILRSAEAVGAWLAGDAAPLSQWWRGQTPGEDLGRKGPELRQRWEAELGPYQGLGDVSVAARRDGVGCAVPLIFRDGTRHLVLHWRDDRVTGITASQGPPWSPGGRVEIFPLSRDSFVFRSLREDAPSLDVLFRINQGGGTVSAIVITTATRPVVAERLR